MNKRPLEHGVSIVDFWAKRTANAWIEREQVEEDWKENRRILNSADYLQPEMDENTLHAWENDLLQTGRALVPSIVFRAPEFRALPVTEEDERTIEIAERNIAWCVDQVGLKGVQKECVWDALACSFGVMKVGWLVQQVNMDMPDSARSVSELRDKTEQVPQSLVKQELVTIGIGSRPFTYRVDPLNFIRSRGSTSVSNAAWVAERMYLRLDEVKASPFFKNTSGLKPNAGASIESYKIRSGRSDKGYRKMKPEENLSDPDDELVELVEVWDRMFNELVVFSPGCDKVLHRGPWPYELLGRFPYPELKYLQWGSVPYPIPYLSTFKQLAKTRNLMSMYALDHTTRAGGKVFYNQQMIDPNDAEKLQGNDPIPVIPVKNGMPRDAVHVQPGVNLNADVGYVDGMLAEKINRMSSVNEVIRGGGPSKGELATQTAIRAESFSVLLEEMTDITGDFLVEWATLMDLLSKEFLDAKHQIRIAGEKGFEFLRYSKANLEGRREYKFIPGSTKILNADQEAQKAVQQLNVIAPLATPGSMTINGNEAVKPLLKKLGFTNLDALFDVKTPYRPVDPREENYLLLQGGSARVSPQEDLQEHLEIHTQLYLAVKDSPAISDDIKAEIKRHIEDTFRTAAEQRMQAELEQMTAGLEGAPMPGGAPEPSPGGPGTRGPGRGGPMRPGPVRPRVFAESNPSQAQAMGAAQREDQPLVPGVPAGV